jgi:prepilin-type processing-associated H-X9-DG protein
MINRALIVGCLAATVLGCEAGPRSPPLRSQCQNNIRQLVLALLNYEAENGHLPPPFTTDANGKPMHSWRVLILPYIEGQQVFDQIDFTKPWNHPDNLRLADKMPAVFSCPSAVSSVPPYTTAYVAVTGGETVWGDSITFGSIRDGASQTVLLIESEARRTHWMAPADVLLDEIVPMSPTGESMFLRGFHKGRGNAAFCDGSVRALSDDMDASVLRALLTRDGGETIEPTAY